MACTFLLQIKGIKSKNARTQFTLGPAIDSESIYSIDKLYEDLSKMSKSDLNQLLTSLEEALELNKINSEFKPLNNYDSRRAIHTLTNHLKLLGVSVQEEYPKNSNVVAWTEDGVIHLNMNTDCVTAAMHEMLHLVTSVMRVNDYGAYQRLLQLVENYKPFLDLYGEICNNPTYLNMTEFDKKEEAFCRMMEELIDEELNVHNFKLDDIPYDDINKILNPFISETFGIEKVPDLLNFFNSTISELPTYGSTLFLKQSSFANGYSEHKELIILAGRITNLISQLVQQGKITENCI